MWRVSIFIFLWFSISVSFAQQSEVEKIDSLLQILGKKHTKLDSTFAESLRGKSHLIANSNAPEETKIYLFSTTIQHLKHLNKLYNFEINESHETNLLEWLPEFLTVSINNSSEIQNAIKRNLPEVYPFAEVYLKKHMTDGMRKEMATSFPNEVLYHLQYMNTVNHKNSIEAEIAAKSLPSEAKKFLHYTNNINSLLSQSKDDTLKIIFDVFKKHRFSGLSYPLINEIAKGRLTIEQAEKVCQDNVLFLNKLVTILYDQKIVGEKDVNKKLNELTTPYLKKLRFQRYVSLDKMDIGKIEELSNRALWHMLIANNVILDLREVSNYLQLILPYFEEKKLNHQDIIVYEPSLLFSLLDKLVPNQEVLDLFSKLFEEPLEKMFENILNEEIGAKRWESWRQERIKKPESKEITVKALPKKGVLEVAPEPFIEQFIFTDYKFSLSSEEKQKLKTKRDYLLFKEKLDSALNHPLEEQLIFHLAKAEPLLILKNFDKIYKKEYSQKLIDQLGKRAPMTVKSYLTAAPNLMSLLLKESEDDTIKLLFSIHDSLGNATRAYFFLNDIAAGKISMKEADTLAKVKVKLIDKLTETILLSENTPGWFSVNQELSYQALAFVRNLIMYENNAIDYWDMLNNMDAKTLYLYIVLSEKEIIKNVFKKMLSVLHSKVKGDAFIDFIEKDMNGFRLTTFYRMMAFYNQTHVSSDFFQKRQKTLHTLFSILDKKGIEDSRYLIDLGEIIVHSHQKGIFSDMEKIIREKYDAAIDKKNNSHEVAVYGMLGSLLGNKLKMGWSKSAASHYNVSHTIGLSGYELFNQDLTSVHQYFFYNDEDGIASYRNFINQYRQSAFNWQITDKGSFIIIESTNGRKVIILANKPESDEDGIKNVLLYLKKENLNPYVVVHRGLSTHVLKTFNRIPSSAKIILDGSCGGFHVQHVALDNAPSAQILCNRNVGTMHLNDPLFKQISEEIRLGNDINWETFWEKMEAKLGSNKYFSDYIPPHKNVSSIILKKYYELLKIDEE